MINIPSIIAEHRAAVDSVESLIPAIKQLAERLTGCLRQGGKILFMGNGGSAADAQHLAAELIGRFTRERRALPAIALTTDTSIMTALANDYDFDRIFARQVEGLCRKEDAVVGISTSGNSANVLAALDKAREIGAHTVGLAGGSGGRLPAAVDTCLIVPSRVTARIQEVHILIGHILCDWIEDAMQEESGRV